MANETIELAKNYDPKQVAKHLPAFAQIKYDGVPIRFIREADGVKAYTRQGEVVTSVPHLATEASAFITNIGGSMTAEVLLPGKPFKDSSGAVRKNLINTDLIGMVFDVDLLNKPETQYAVRMEFYKHLIRTLGIRKLKPVYNLDYCRTDADVESAWEHIRRDFGSDIEGMMLHRTDKPFQPGKRCWGLGRYKPQPTIDLEVISFEEARSEAGEPLGMVGRVNVRLRRLHQDRTISEATVGIGPGKLSHDERRAIWQTLYKVREDKVLMQFNMPLIAVIKYMPDPSYEALRQPTLQYLRHDKSEGDVLDYNPR